MNAATLRSRLRLSDFVELAGGDAETRPIPELTSFESRERPLKDFENRRVVSSGMSFSSLEWKHKHVRDRVSTCGAPMHRRGGVGGYFLHFGEITHWFASALRDDNLVSLQLRAVFARRSKWLKHSW